MSDALGSGQLSRERLLTLVLGLLTLLSLYLCYRIIRPFIPPVAIGVAVAVATQQPHRWLRRKLRSKTAAAAVCLALVACLIIVPVGLLLMYVVQQITESVKQLQSNGGIPDWHTVLGAPSWLNHTLEWVEGNLDIRTQLSRLGQTLAGKAGAFLAGSVSVVTQLVIMLFVLFFLYRDGERGLKVLQDRLPFSNEETGHILKRIEDTILATVNGSLTVAMVQATLAGIMYTVLAVPGSAIWAAATFVVALVPVLGTVLVWGPVSIYLLLSGSWVKAVILVLWGMLAVGTIDNLLYPYLVGGRLRLHPVPTFFSILGGVALLGPAGVILGPVAVAVTIALLDVWLQRTASAPVPGQ